MCRHARFSRIVRVYFRAVRPVIPHHSVPVFSLRHALILRTVRARFLAPFPRGRSALVFGRRTFGLCSLGAPSCTATRALLARFTPVTRLFHRLCCIKKRKPAAYSPGYVFGERTVLPFFVTEDSDFSSVSGYNVTENRFICKQIFTKYQIFRDDMNRHTADSSTFSAPDRASYISSVIFLRKARISAGMSSSFMVLCTSQVPAAFAVS